MKIPWSGHVDTLCQYKPASLVLSYLGVHSFVRWIHEKFFSNFYNNLIATSRSDLCKIRQKLDYCVLNAYNLTFYEYNR